MMQTKTNPGAIYFTPAESGKNWIEYVKHINDGDGIRWATRKMNDHILPLRAGKIAAILALPGNGKSTFAVEMARRYAEGLRLANDQEQAVLYVTVDQPQEEIASMVYATREHTVTDFVSGKVDEAMATRIAMSNVDLPFYIAGKSVISQRTDQPRLTYENIELGIKEMWKHVHRRPALIVVDYLQSIPIEGRFNERTQRVTEAIVKSRELCLTEKIPMVLCVQVTRESRDREIKIPTAQDCQWSSAIEQEADVILGLWRPKTTELDRTEITLKSHHIPITPELMLVGLVKQRMKAAGMIFALHFNMGTFEVQDMELL